MNPNQINFDDYTLNVMKKNFKILITLVLLFIESNTFGQEYQFDILNTSLKEYILLEKELGSEIIQSNSNHISFTGEAQPIKFKRTQKIIPNLVTYLYFQKKDSTMSKVLYEWDIKNDNKSGEKQSNKFIKKLIKQHKKLEKLLTKLYGKPEGFGNLSEIEKVDKNGGLKRNCKWYPNDRTTIELYIVTSNYTEKRGIISIKPTHRIRLYIRKVN